MSSARPQAPLQQRGCPTAPRQGRGAATPAAPPRGRDQPQRTRTSPTDRTPHGASRALISLLEHQIVDHVYGYGIAAAETVPVALALATAAHGRIAEAVPAAACLSRVADSARPWSAR